MPSPLALLQGLAISNDEKIRSTHNSFARQEPFLSDTRDDSAKEKEAFHFIAYLPHGGKVYELDGLKPGPIVLGEANDNWLDIATPAIQERIARYSTSEIRFNLMAIVKNRRWQRKRRRCMRGTSPVLKLQLLGNRVRAREPVQK
ncbi:unnamed protein product [Discosporangium mesarthrocarpum]